MSGTTHRIVSHQQWLEERVAHLEQEKRFTRLRDELSAARRALPWERVEKNYTFVGQGGEVTLADLFDGRSQLIVYHFMFGPDWKAGCKSCSFWIDNFTNLSIHLNHRDTSLVVVSRAPWDKLEAYRRRMGWNLPWVSSLESDFNYDHNVSFTPEEVENGTGMYNYRNDGFGMDEAPGISVFRHTDDEIFHTYSTYGRGLDMLNAAYHLLDLTPKGRDEELTGNMCWLRRRDEYDGDVRPGGV